MRDRRAFEQGGQFAVRGLVERKQRCADGAGRVASTCSFSPALYDTFAIITRPGARLSPGVREVLTDVEAHMRAVSPAWRPS